MAEVGQIIGIILGVSVILGILYYVYAVVVGGYDTTLKNEPWLLKGTKSATEMLVIPGKQVPYSSDGQYGIEFSYSLWMFIQQGNVSTRSGGNQHVLHRGSNNAKTLLAPGIWIDANTNKLYVFMNTFSSTNTEVVSIENIPMNKWVHVVVVLMNRYIDIYINGDLKQRYVLSNLPRQNPGNVYLNAFGGFPGFLSNVRYFNYALPLWKIDQLVSQGPSDMPVLSEGEKPPYLARDWWMGDQIKKTA